MKLRKSSVSYLSFMIMAVALLVARGDVAWAQETNPADKQESDGTAVDERFGIVEAFWRADDAAELGVGWDRILFYWNEIQPTGPDDWNTLHVLEEWLNDARAENRMVMGLLKNTPAWATDAEPYSGVPRGLYLPVDDPANLWAGYVRKVVEYYAPLGVHHWIVWNEPEIGVGVYGHEFSGSTRDYYQLLKVASQVAKQRDPEAVIHLAGWSYWHDPAWLGKFLSIATADPEGAANDYFFDIVTLHIYFRVETVEELVEETWAIQKRYGLNKPVWINETNASPNLDPLWPVERPNFQVDLEQQAWYIIQAHALGFGANATSIGIYKLLDILLPPGGESFGILRPDGSRRPAFDAYRTTIRYLEDFVFPVGRQQEEDFYAFSFRRPDSVTRILWARTSTDLILKVPALANEARLVSALGDYETTLKAYQGHYRIRLRGAHCAPACDIGGPPVFLVEQTAEELSVEQMVTIAPESAIMATATPTPSVEEATNVLPTVPRQIIPLPTFWPGPSATPTREPTSTPTASPSPSPTLEPSFTATPLALSFADDATAGMDQPVDEEKMLLEATPEGTVWLVERAGNLGSWLFLAAAVLLGGLLIMVAFRYRQSR
ncbi:MAG: hypothetical protein KC410_02140 [Anaerolineales bacterium]|uniref:hypothetical protein n=1 Tax=Promineifilum sp. TaxID=2664178 RepID=UPI001D720935|nr:hypothetical protein [Anaerolineales bacterium]MCO5178604.1 hypothetical protein [Promineifilum sp.]